jgi:glycerophosphoryl diester phosphodiesterase
MKFILPLLLLAFTETSAQVKIHAHNDYEKPLPLYNALSSQVYSIEADVFLRNGDLLVAHSSDQLPNAKSLSELYILPLVTIFKKNKGHLSADTGYRSALMIDIKQGGEDAIRQLCRLLDEHREYFDRSRNRHAMQIIISGDRGNIKNWTSFPAYIYFDGRPTEQYDPETMKRVACISDSYASYAENREKLIAVLERTHQAARPFRFWGTPDNEFYWKYFRDTGVDIINTDKPDLCSSFFEKEKAAGMKRQASQ